jgi:hypothetical protein
LAGQGRLRLPEAAGGEAAGYIGPAPAATQALVPALRCGQAARLKREAPAEIVPAHELAGHVLTAITARSGCDHVVFRVDDGTFAVVHLTWTTRQEPDPGQPHSGSEATLPWKR